MRAGAANRWKIGKVDFAIPQGFIGDVLRARDEVLLLATDKSKTIELRVERDCLELTNELSTVVEDLAEEIIQPVTEWEVNGMRGVCTAFKGHRHWYCEWWLNLEEHAIRIILRSSFFMDAAAMQTCLAALDIRLI